jgi:hypothetical protein
MERLAAELDDWTFIYHRVNPAGLVVRDAKFIEDAGSYDVAVILFKGLTVDDGADVGLCAVLRGKVTTVDDVELADQQPGGYAWRDRLAVLDNAGAAQERFTVLGSWDTGDGPRRYSKNVRAVNAEHAELLVRADKTVGTFLVAGVVEGWVPVEDADEVWATIDGQPPQAPDTRSWLRRKLDGLTG